MKPIHLSHPICDIAHPLKSLTLCGRMLRFGRMRQDIKSVTCKLCIRMIARIQEDVDLQDIKEARKETKLIPFNQVREQLKGNQHG